jgi:hypothetical protein
VPFVDVSALDLVGVITDPPRAASRDKFRPVGPGPSPTSSPCKAAVPQGPIPIVTPTPTLTRTPAPHATATATASPHGSAVARPSATRTP